MFLPPAMPPHPVGALGSSSHAGSETSRATPASTYIRLWAVEKVPALLFLKPKPLRSGNPNREVLFKMQIHFYESLGSNLGSQDPAFPSTPAWGPLFGGGQCVPRPGRPVAAQSALGAGKHGTPRKSFLCTMLESEAAPGRLARGHEAPPCPPRPGL